MGLYEAKCNVGRYRVGQLYDVPDDRLEEIRGHLDTGRIVPADDPFADLTLEPDPLEPDPPA